MLCEICNKNEATIQFINQNSSGDKNSIMLCETCAIDIMKSSFDKENIDLNDYILDDELLEIDYEACKNCGTEYIDFEENKVLGCERCYENFRPKIREYLEWKGYGKHTGKRPSSLEKYFRGKEILQLEEQLKMNILNEEYDKAILTKEKIDNMKKNI